MAGICHVAAMRLFDVFTTICGNLTLSFGRCCLSFIHLAISCGHLPYSGFHLKAAFITTWSLLSGFYQYLSFALLYKCLLPFGYCIESFGKCWCQFLAIYGDMARAIYVYYAYLVLAVIL